MEAKKSKKAAIENQRGFWLLRLLSWSYRSNGHSMM